MAESKNQKNPLKLIIFKCIFFFFIFEFGTSVTINSFLIYNGYSSRFFFLFYQSFWTTLILYIIMLISLYTSKKLFHYLYYLFFVFVTWFYHNTGGFIGLFILNKIIIELPQFLNLLIFICFGTGLSLLCIFTDNFPKFDRIKIKCPKLDGNMTIVHLTDLHLGGAYGRESVELYVNMILSLKETIDFVVITGDLVDGNIKVTKEMLEPFNLIKVPIYYITGNHEDLTWKDEFLDLIENHSNLIHVQNKSITIDKRINLIGIDYKKNAQLIKGQLKNIVTEKKNNLPNVFIYHAPILKTKELQDYNIFLMLCGHKHGGWCFPFTLLILLFKKWIKVIIEGLYCYNDKNYVYCCSGLGTSGPNSRCFIRANIGLILLEGNS